MLLLLVLLLVLLLLLLLLLLLPGIPENATARVNGTVNSKTRERYWKEKKVFYCTPQTLRNDIEKGLVDVRTISCVVVDEAHRASGKFAYVEGKRIVVPTLLIDDC